MERSEIIEELMDKLEAELDELSSAQLSLLLVEYEHMEMLGDVVAGLETIEVADDNDEDEDEEEDLPLIDGEFTDDEDE